MTVMTYLRFVATKLSVAVCKTLEANGELNITTAHYILNFELREFGVEAQFLHDTRVFTRRQTRIVLRLRARHDHLARCKDEGGSLRISNTHNDGRETLDHAKIEQFDLPQTIKENIMYQPWDCILHS